VANLLPRFFEVTRGTILVSGTDIRDVTLRSLRDNMAMVTQEMILFNDTIRNNIAYGARSATFEEVMEAARAANATSSSRRCPTGTTRWWERAG
jgi:subfamily B ATP-binding cassette protein MsbA